MTELIKTEGEITTLTQENTYAHNGIRISRTENGTSRDYYYDNGVVAFTKDGNSTSTANIMAEDGAAVGTYRGNDYHTYLKDMQGSTTNLVKQDGTLSAAYDYSDFGETEEITGSNFDNQSCYTGGIYDEETGLYYFNARYYDPVTGRFISQDTYRGEVGEPGTWHLYAYCANNPINYVDPSGHKYSPTKAVQYALKRVHNWSTNYKAHRYDCTNFVSQCLEAGGLSQKRPKNIDDKPDMWETTKYWYSKKYKIRSGRSYQNAWKESTSWVNVKAFYTYWSTRIVNLSVCKSKKSLQNKAKIGDVVQFYSDNSGWHHSVIITGGEKGDLKYSCHSRNRRNRLVSKIPDSEKKFRIVRPKI